MLGYEEMPCRERPRGLMVWLHGLGADGYDLQPAAEMLDLARIRHVFPHAPVRPVTINGGMAMRAWYDIAATDLSRQEDAAGMLASARQILELVNDLGRDSGLPVILAGFSQGAVVSLAAASMGMPNLTAVVAMSGYVPECLQPSLAGLSGLPVFMGHGEEDSVIPFRLARSGAENLVQAGAAVAWHAYAMPHTICQQELGDLSGWLKQLPCLGQAR